MNRLIFVICALSIPYLHAGDDHDIWCSVQRAICENAMKTNPKVNRIYIHPRTSLKITDPDGMLNSINHPASSIDFFNCFREAKGKTVPLCNDLLKEYPILGFPAEYWQKADEASRWASTHVPTEPDYRETDFGYYYLVSELKKTAKNRCLVLIVQSVFYFENDDNNEFHGYSLYGQGTTRYQVFGISVTDNACTVKLIDSVDIQGN